MKTTLSPQQIESYRRDGFLSYPGLLSAAEVAELKEAVLEAVASLGNLRVADGDEKHLIDQEADSYFDQALTQRLNLWRINDRVKQDVLSPDLGRMLCELTGVPAMRVWHDQALIKEPFGNPTGWHLDNPYWSFYSRDSISIWIALEEATALNGCMSFLPGSHHLARFDNCYISSHQAALFDVYPEMAKIDPVAVPMKPGDCSFHNGLCAHGAGANMTRGRRIAMTCAYMPAGSTFNGQQNVLPDKYAATLKVGDVLENDDWNPLVYATEDSPAAAG